MVPGVFLVWEEGQEGKGVYGADRTGFIAGGLKDTSREVWKSGAEGVMLILRYTIKLMGLIGLGF